jgi:hypothetical protein
MEYIGSLLEPVKEKKSLSQERYEQSMKKIFKTKYSLENEDDTSSSITEGESLLVPPWEQVEEVGDSEERSEEKYFGRNVVVSPLAYYTLSDSLKHALGDYKDQIRETTNFIMANRGRKFGQKAATMNNSKDVLGEYPEKNVEEQVVSDGNQLGSGLTLKRHYFTRPINGIMYRITIDEHPVGLGQARRNTYMLVDIAVIFYRKNGIGLGKEIVLRSRVLRFRKRAPR